MLFKTLETQEYLLQTSQVNTTGQTLSPKINPSDQAVNSQESTEPISTQLPTITNPTLSVQLNGSAAIPISNKRESQKSESEKDDKDKRPKSR